MGIGDEQGFSPQRPLDGVVVERGGKVGLFQKCIALEFAQQVLRWCIGGRHARLRCLQAHGRLLDGWQQAQRHAPCQPETKFLLVLGVQTQ